MNRTADLGVFARMKTTKLLAFARLPLLSALAVAPFSGCVFVDRNDPPPPPPDPFGDIAFNWSFDGINDCDVAGVDELDIVIFQDGQVFEEIEGEPCIGGGLILTDFLNGRYELEIDAYSRDNILLYSGDFSIRVEGGVENDAGTINFDPINAPPPPPPPVLTGSVGFNWLFVYPAAQAIESCAVAGVVDVDVVLTNEFGDEVRDTFNCAATAGANFDNLAEGLWTAHVDAYGRYHNADVHLYGVSVDVEVIADDLTDLGDLALARDEGSFTDLEVVWDFVAESCATAGINELTLAVQRTGLDQPEDVTTVQCTSLSATRRTFVPGSYTVSLTGIGSSDTYVGFASIDAAPDTVAHLNIHLAPEAP